MREYPDPGYACVKMRHMIGEKSGHTCMEKTSCLFDGKDSKIPIKHGKDYVYKKYKERKREGKGSLILLRLLSPQRAALPGD